MSNTRNAIARASLLAIAGLAGCSGGGSNGPSAAAGSSSLPAASTPGTSAQAMTRSVKLFIPARPVASARSSSIRGAASTRRPLYISSATASVTIATSQNGTTIGSATFQTTGNSPNCTGSGGGTTCTVTIGVLSGTDQIAVTAYDANGVALEADSGSVSVAAGVDNQIPIVLGGIPASFTLASTNGLDVATSGVFSFAGEGPATTIDFNVIALDNSGETILSGASDPLATPIDFTLSETGQTGLSTIALQTTNPDNTTTTGTPGTSVAVTSGATRIVLTYDGHGSLTPGSEYSATLAGTTTAYADPVASVGTAQTSVPPPYAFTSVAAPLFVEPNLANAAPSTTFAMDPTTYVPTLTQTMSSGSMNSVVFALASAQASTQPNDSNAPQPGYPQDQQTGGAPCAGVVFPAFGQATNAYVPQVLGGAAYTCQFHVGDGTTNGTQPVDFAFSPPAGQVVSVYPSSNTFYAANSSIYANQFSFTTYDVGRSNPTYRFTGCVADANSGCYVHNDDSDDLCMNGEGYVGIYLYQNVPYFNFNPGNYTGFSTDPNAASTADFTCRMTLADDAGNTIVIPVHYDSVDASMPLAAVRAHVRPTSKIAAPGAIAGPPTAALARYNARTQASLAKAATVRAMVLRSLRPAPNAANR